MEAKSLPLIGLTTYGRNDENWFELPAQYVDSVRRAGGVPVLLPPGEPHLADWFESIDAMILPGGGDLSPETYGGTPHAENYKMDADRDRDEIILARLAVESGLPTLAICRGMQVLNVALGGSLIEHLPDVVGEAVPHRNPEREPIAHAVTTESGSKLAAVMQQASVSPESWHHQAVRDVADGLTVVAHAADGTIEAMEVDGHPWLLAVQWHPELTAAKDPTQQRLFDALVAAAVAET